MASEELVVRLNHREYKNWLKAGRCLLILKEALHPFTDHHMRRFHGELLNNRPLPQNTCRASCKPRANKLLSLCRVCSEWKKVILEHHRQPDSTINWDNCVPQSWAEDHWEVAKAYMPRGQAKKRSAGQCDAAALLNLINNCRCFSVDPKVVIRARNELMHSSEFQVTDEWLRNFRISVKLFMQRISQDARMEKAARQIDEMLRLDLLISVPGLDLTDGLEADSVGHFAVSLDLVSQWEAELLQEMLQEFLVAAEDGDTRTQDAEEVAKLRGFLEASKDLTKKFSAELQVLNSL